MLAANILGADLSVEPLVEDGKVTEGRDDVNFSVGLDRRRVKARQLGGLFKEGGVAASEAGQKSAGEANM